MQWDKPCFFPRILCMSGLGRSPPVNGKMCFHGDNEKAARRRPDKTETYFRLQRLERFASHPLWSSMMVAKSYTVPRATSARLSSASL